MNFIKNKKSLGKKRWEIADVQIDGSAEAQQGIRFNLFQLFSTYYGEDERLNIGLKDLLEKNMAEQLIGIQKPMPFHYTWHFLMKKLLKIF